MLVKMVRKSCDCIQMSRAPAPAVMSLMSTIDFLLLVVSVISNQMINPARIIQEINELMD